MGKPEWQIPIAAPRVSLPTCQHDTNMGAMSVVSAQLGKSRSLLPIP
jgi:hypothetical protein